MTAPSNANTSGLEVLATVVSAHGDPEAFGEREIEVVADLSRIPYNTALVTAASAQARIDAEKARADRLAKALKETRNRVREWPIDDHETCMCGSPVASHGMGDGHSPVSQGDHAISMIVEAINEALQQETQP